LVSQQCACTTQRMGQCPAPKPGGVSREQDPKSRPTEARRTRCGAYRALRVPAARNLTRQRPPRGPGDARASLASPVHPPAPELRRSLEAFHEGQVWLRPWMHRFRRGPKIRKYELPLSSRSSRDETWTNLDVLPSTEWDGIRHSVRGVGRCATERPVVAPVRRPRAAANHSPRVAKPAASLNVTLHNGWRCVRGGCTQEPIRTNARGSGPERTNATHKR